MDRVILVPRPEKEMEVVQKIYTRFVTDKQTEREMAEQLNGAGILGEHGRLWTRVTVHEVLTNPKYIGANIYNRRSFKLKHKRINNPVDMWIWRNGASVPIVDHEEAELIAAVEGGRLPISVAVEIANGKDREISEAPV